MVKLSGLLKCKSPLENFHMVSTYSLPAPHFGNGPLSTTLSDTIGLLRLYAERKLRFYDGRFMSAQGTCMICATLQIV